MRWPPRASRCTARRTSSRPTRAGVGVGRRLRTGRVGIELARRGFEVVGVDVDASMLATARRTPGVDLGPVRPDGVGPGPDVHPGLLAGNVPLFTPPGTQPALVARGAAHVAPNGHLVAGFSLTGATGSTGGTATAPPRGWSSSTASPPGPGTRSREATTPSPSTRLAQPGVRVRCRLGHRHLHPGRHLVRQVLRADVVPDVVEATPPSPAEPEGLSGQCGGGCRRDGRRPRRARVGLGDQVDLRQCSTCRCTGALDEAVAPDGTVAVHGFRGQGTRPFQRRPPSNRRGPAASPPGPAEIGQVLDVGGRRFDRHRGLRSVAFPQSFSIGRARAADEADHPSGRRIWPGRAPSPTSSPSRTIGRPLTMVACTPSGRRVAALAVGEVVHDPPSRPGRWCRGRRPTGRRRSRGGPCPDR